MTTHTITSIVKLNPNNPMSSDSTGVETVRPAPNRWALPGATVRPAAERMINRTLESQPSQGDYRIHNGRLIPGTALSMKLGAVQHLYPKILTSFLDIGSRKGYFVLDAATRHPYCRAVGLEAQYPLVQLATQSRDYLALGNAAFYRATLDELGQSDHPDVRPFQTVLFLGTYHNLFWGSQISPTAYLDHRAILSRLARLNTERMIFSAPLEIDRLPANLRTQARNHPAGFRYNTRAFLAAAQEFYEVASCGYLGQESLFLMNRQ